MLNAALHRLRLSSLQLGKSLLFSVLMSALLLPAWAEVNPEQAQQAQQQLAERLDQLGPFEAEYTAISPEKRALVKVVYHPARKFAMLQILFEEEQNPVYTVVLDYAQTDRLKGGFEMLIITPESAERYPVALKELFDSLNSPLGVFAFFSDSLAGGGPAERPETPQQLQLQLGLTEADLLLSLGMSLGKGQLTGSWLSEDLSQLQELKQTSDRVSFVFPGKHEIVVQKSTGLLALDSWPHSEKSGLRELRLKEFTALKDQRPYQERISGFKQLQIVDAPGDQLYRQMYSSFLSGLALSLENSPQWQNLLKQGLSVADKQRLYAQALERIEELPALELQTDAVRYYLDTVLLPAWKNSQHKQFKDFSQELLNQLQNQRFQLELPPGTSNFLDGLDQNTRMVLELIPAQQASGLLQLHELAMPILAEAWTQEILKRYLEEAASLKPVK